jgi:hypothetical protein
MFRRASSWLREQISRILGNTRKLLKGEAVPPSGSPLDNVISFYEENYRLAGSNLILKAADKRYFGERTNRRCRFCGKTESEVSFKQETHALPEAIGNKSLITHYECDDCNQKFGRGIETEFGKWSKPLRLFYQIRGKSGVPSLKRDGENGWRIDLQPDGFVFQQYVEHPVVHFDETKEELCVEVPVDQHVPIAVFKSFVKMALSLLPEDEASNFQWAFDWLQEDGNTRPFHPEMARVWYTFTPGPRPFEGVTTFLFIRKDTTRQVPYCIFVLAVGNECYQVFVPCPEKDQALRGTQVTMPILPTPYHSLDRPLGKSSRPNFYDLSNVNPVRVSIKRCFHAQLAAREKPTSSNTQGKMPLMALRGICHNARRLARSLK